MIEIHLRDGYKAVIDDEDGPTVLKWRWYLYDYKRTFYAQSTDGTKMHELIIPIIPYGYVRHHKDGNGLNNRRSNLEIRTNLENLQEKKMYKNNKTGYPGVKQKPTGFEAQISVMGTRKYLGIFCTFEEAKAARIAAEQKYRKD